MSFRQKLHQMIAKMLSRAPLAGRAWGRFVHVEIQPDVPWAPICKPLRECRVCLITTGGLHLRDAPPFDMEDPEGDPSYRTITRDACAEGLMITHNYYNHQDADRDFNILLPLDRLRELVRMGFVGELSPTHYSFMGHIDGPHLSTLQEKILPELLSNLFEERPDFAFLTPA